MASARRWFAVALLLPLAALLLGMQVAALVALWGMGNMGLGALTKSSEQFERGGRSLAAAVGIVSWTWNSPAAAALSSNPLTMGVVDDLGELAEAAEVAAGAIDPATGVAAVALGFDGNPKLVSGGTVNLEMLPALRQPNAELNAVLTATEQALVEVNGTGPLGTPVSRVAQQWLRIVRPMTQLTESLALALPSMPDALGQREPKRYLVCALNDAETFASGGAPLAAVMVEAVQGAITVPVSGQMESKLSPNNPPITWEYQGGLPWYRDDGQYPFVNSNFAPDFRTAGSDMRKAWAALGYPAVDGVVTVDVTALSRILAWIGPVQTNGYQEITADNLARKILVDAYREFNSPEGVEVRHQRNTELAEALAQAVLRPERVLDTMSGVMSAIPDRHIQASFVDAGMQAAVTNLGASGRLANEPGDLLGVFSQSGPNKLAVFQQRSIDHQVVLTPGGGAKVRQTIRLANAVPNDLSGDPTTYKGYVALLSRLRVAYRMPAAATDWTIDIGPDRPLVKPSRVGPYPDGSGGKVLWQGQDTKPGQTTTVVISYRLPAGTWSGADGLPVYTLAADPQPLAKAVRMRITVAAADGVAPPRGDGDWRQTPGGLTWTGNLDRPIRLSLSAGGSG